MFSSSSSLPSYSFLKLFFSPFALAVWIMDFGSLSSGCLLLRTPLSFFYSDFLLLQRFLFSFYSLDTRLRTVHPFSFFFPNSSIPRLALLVKPFLVPSKSFLFPF